MPRTDPAPTPEQQQELNAFVQEVTLAEEEDSLKSAIQLFRAHFLLLRPSSRAGEDLRGALKAMAFNMDAMQLDADTLSKCKRLFVGNADLLPDCLVVWQLEREAARSVAPAAAAAAVNTPKATKVEVALAAAISAGLLAPETTKGKLKEAAKRMESTGAPGLSQRAIVRYAGGNWVSEPKTLGLPGAKEHGFFRAAWRDARQDFPAMDPSQVMLMVWAAARHFMAEVCREDLAGELNHILWLAEVKLLHPLVAMALAPDKAI